MRDSRSRERSAHPGTDRDSEEPRSVPAIQLRWSRFGGDAQDGRKGSLGKLVGGGARKRGPRCRGCLPGEEGSPGELRARIALKPRGVEWRTRQGSKAVKSGRGFGPGLKAHPKPIRSMDRVERRCGEGSERAPFRTKGPR